MAADRDKEVSIGFDVARKAIDATGYGNWVSDAVVTQLVSQVVDAIDAYRASQSSPK